MTTIDFIFLAACTLYIVQGTILIYGATRARYKKNLGNEPLLSVVVAARNEEKNIERTLASLSALDYPKQKLEIIVVDDSSTDATLKIMQRYSGRFSFIRTITAKQPESHLRGKSNAISQGIDISRGEIIMLTDADCAVPPSWAKAAMEYFDDQTGVVAGLTLLEYTSWFGGMQSVDWTFILAIAASTMSLGNPLSCIGNNFSFRRKAYNEVGGYRGIKFSVTEDYALFKAITGSGKWNYKYPLDEETLVLSLPCGTVKDLYRQKRRWGVGGKDMRFSGMLIMAVSFFMHALLITGYVLGIAWQLLLSGVLLKLTLDFFLVLVPLKQVHRTDHLKYFFAFELYLFVTVIVLPFAVFFGGDVLWKGRRY
ncbi:MAG: glycosyltransferase [Bacteroidota bacterium]|nr:glycosyltransferase [Bacteroidota bacterium]